jgi:hypothetical protein
VSLERAQRLYRLIQLLEAEPQRRATVLRRLRIDIRTFYRDMELLRECEIAIDLSGRKYSLPERAANLLPRLPFPDPGLTLGEVKVLARGRSAVHKKLKRVLDQIVKA